MRAVREFAALLALAIALAAPAASAQQADPPPLHIVTSMTINSMNPSVQGFWMHEYGVGEMLMQFRNDGQFHPWLAKDVQAVDPLHWKITLRPEVKFQNGKPVTAAAVVASLNRQVQFSAASKFYVPADAKFTATGDWEVTVTTDKPWPGLPAVLSNESPFMIYDAETVNKVGDNWQALVGAGIYTGPYQVVALNSSHMEAKRFDGYWQGKPALPGLTVNFVVDANARILAVQNDEADIAIYPPAVSKVAVDKTPGLHFLVAPGYGSVFLYTHSSAPPLSDVRLRQALEYAIDYKQIADVVMGGQYKAPTGWFQSLFPFAIHNQMTDVAKANTLLDQAGWAKGADGMRARDGTKLNLTLLITPQLPDLVPMSTAIQSQLRAVGVAVDIRSVDDANAAIVGGSVKWDAALTMNASTNWGAVEPILNRFFLPGGDRNWGPYNNPELVSLAAELQVTFDPARRNAILKRIQEIMVEDPEAFDVADITARVIVNDRYKGYAPGFALYHVSWQTRPTP